MEYLSPLNDFVFSYLFGEKKHIEILAGFLKAVLKLSDDECKTLTLVNPFVKKKVKDDKLGIVDVRMETKNGGTIHVELQVAKDKYMKERLLFYNYKMFTSPLKEGEDYGKLKQVISILICAYNLLPGEKPFINTYRLRNDESGKSFTDLTRFVILELPKMDKNEADALEKAVWPWMKFFVCKNEAEFTELAENHKELSMAVAKVREMSLDETLRWEAFKKIDRRRIEAGVRAAAFDDGMAEKQQEIARNLKAMGDPLEKIAKVTGLSVGEIEKLSD